MEGYLLNRKLFQALPDNQRAKSYIDTGLQSGSRKETKLHVYLVILYAVFICFQSISFFFCSSTEIDDMLRKSTNLLLSRTLSSCLQNLIKKPHIGLTEVSAENVF